ERPQQMTRFQLLARVLAFCVLGILGVSFGGLFLATYLALPVFAAVRVSGAGNYVADDGPRVTRFLRWLAAVSAWAGLITDRLPAHTPDETLHLEIAHTGRPTASSALWRVITGLPSAFV